MGCLWVAAGVVTFSSRFNNTGEVMLLGFLVLFLFFCLHKIFFLIPIIFLLQC